jgi:hypothetical protein
MYFDHLPLEVNRISHFFPSLVVSSFTFHLFFLVHQSGMCKDKSDVAHYWLAKKVAYYNLPRGK